MERFITVAMKNSCTLNKEIVAVKTVFYLNGHKITRKDLNNLLGKAVVRNLVLQAKETHFIDPLVQNDFFLGSYGMLTICFV